MRYVQVKQPNLDPVIYQGGKVLYNWLGYCLAYVQTAFGAGWAGPYAWDAWTNRVGYRHTSALPSGVYVPIWFDGWWNGKRYGHVAIYKDGKPDQAKACVDVFEFPNRPCELPVVWMSPSRALTTATLVSVELHCTVRPVSGRPAACSR